MAAPTPAEKLRRIGNEFALVWDAHWTDTGEFTDTAILDLSADFGDLINKIKIKTVYIISTTGIEVELQFDATTTDEPIATLPEGATGPFKYDYCDFPDGGLILQEAGAGDVFLTTTGAAAGDRVFMIITGEVY